MTTTVGLLNRQREIRDQMNAIAATKNWEKSKFLVATWNDLEWQASKIAYALARRHYRHNPEKWSKDNADFQSRSEAKGLAKRRD